MGGVSLLSTEPPYLSVLRLESGDKNWAKRRPLAPWISMLSNPALLMREALSTKSSSTSAVVSSRGDAPVTPSIHLRPRGSVRTATMFDLGICPILGILGETLGE